MNPNKVWQEITISDEELEDIIAGIPRTRRGQQRYTRHAETDSTINGGEYEPADDDDDDDGWID